MKASEAIKKLGEIVKTYGDCDFAFFNDEVCIYESVLKLGYDSNFGIAYAEKS